MIVVSDSSPLNYLAQIGHAQVLWQLYGQILVPTAVARELTHAAAPAAVRLFIENPPPWLVIRSAQHLDTTIGLGAGETEAISLAVETKADRILMDDRAAYRAATSRGLLVTGTLTVLADASAKDFCICRRRFRSFAPQISELPRFFCRSFSERMRRKTDDQTLRQRQQNRHAPQHARA